nr:LPD1 domain-containing protein [Moraxella sp. CTOTU48717]
MSTISDIKLLLAGLPAQTNKRYFSQLAEIKTMMQNLATQPSAPTKEDIDFTTKRIKKLAQSGAGVRVTDIDWDALEFNESIAEKTITKANIMGNFDFETMRDNDVDPNVGYVIQKILNTVASKPYWDIAGYLGTCKTTGLSNDSIASCQQAVHQKYSTSEQVKMARKAYVLGVESLKSRLENKTKVMDVYEELMEIGREMNGLMYASEDYKKLNDITQQINDKFEVIKSLGRQLETETHSAIGWKNIVFEDRKCYGVRLTHSTICTVSFACLVSLLCFCDYRSETLAYLQEKYPQRQIVGSGYFIADKSIVDEYNQLIEQSNQLKATRFMESLENNPSKLAWISLGEKFWAIAGNTSRPFVKEVNEALRKKYSDWGLVIPKEMIDPKTGKTKLITKSTFEVQVADTIERISDKQVTIQSQDDLINMFGLRDVGAGSWSNKKKDELQWHMQKCGEAMVDLGDIIGIDPKLLGFDGRLMLTFGVGDRKNVRAHYASSTKTINMSKMKGGGSFGHEWWHAIDNILVSILNKKEMNTRDFLSSTPQLAGNNDRLVDAFRFLNVVLTQTSNSQPLAVKILDAHVKEAINAFENPDANNPYAKTVIGFGNQEDALTYLGEQEKEATGYQSLLQIQTWKQYVVLYYNQDKIGQTVTLPIGYGMSQFRANAIKLDGGKVKYWASVHELAARAFAHYLDKKLIDKGQKSGYLTYATTGDAFPSGKESERIMKAFDNIFNIIREEKILENAVADKALMDSIFGFSV